MSMRSNFTITPTTMVIHFIIFLSSSDKEQNILQDLESSCLSLR